MLHALLCSAAILLQARTVEQRIEEIAARIEVLDKKASQLAAENQELLRQVELRKAQRETIARQSAAGWVKRYGPTAGFGEKLSAELEELWVGWSRSDVEKAPDLAQWKSREETLRGKLTAEQASRLGRKVREDHEAQVKRMLAMVAQLAKLPAEKSAAVEKAAGGKLAFDETILILQAHPDRANFLVQGADAIEACLPDLASTLTAEEQSALRGALGTYRPRK